MNKSHIVIHHSLTKDSATKSWDAIRRYHVEHNGWQDIGYHRGVELIDTNYAWLDGRPLDARAAAAWQNNFNVKGIHICFVGNYDEVAPPWEMLDFSAPYIARICDDRNIPISNIIGHRDVTSPPPKSCPGTKFDLDVLRQLVKGAL